MSQLDTEILIIGSGASAVHTALPLVEAGRKVLMIDIGGIENKKTELIPKSDWKTNRQNDDEQWKYFLGENYEGIPMGPVRVGAQLTPARQHIHRKAEELFPTKDHHFAAMQATCLGGLGTGWGASSMPFSKDDIKGWPISESDLTEHYNSVASEIGMAGPDADDLSDFLGETIPSQKPPKLDSNGEFLLKRYERNREYFNSKGFYLGRSRLAVKTSDKEEYEKKSKLKYLDMEFWGDADESVYRPSQTLAKLQENDNFEYRSGLRAVSFEENEEGVIVRSLDTETGEAIEHKAQSLFIATGAINSARLAMRSFEHYNNSVPLLSNPYTYYPAFNLFRIGQPTKDRRHSLTQLTMLYDHDGNKKNLVQPQLYSYRSLLLFKLIKESPLPTKESIKLFQAIQNYLVIIGVFHEDRVSKGKEVILRKGESQSSDWLEIRYRRAESEILLQQEKEKALCSIFRKLGAYPIKRINPGDGASIHYAGTLPMSEKEKPMTISPDGLLRNTKSVYVTDGSGFPHLPAKGLTMTLMANAQRIATNYLSKSD